MGGGRRKGAVSNVYGLDIGRTNAIVWVVWIIGAASSVGGVGTSVGTAHGGPWCRMLLLGSCRGRGG